MNNSNSNSNDKKPGPIENRALLESCQQDDCEWRRQAKGSNNIGIFAFVAK